MKPFNPEAAKAGAPVCTRDRKDVRIVCYDKKGQQPILALVDDGKTEYVNHYFANGHYYEGGMASENDLFMKPLKKEGWVNIYGHQTVSNHIFSTEWVARDAGDGHQNYLATVRIEWEE